MMFLSLEHYDLLLFTNSTENTCSTLQRLQRREPCNLPMLPATFSDHLAYQGISLVTNPIIVVH